MPSLFTVTNWTSASDIVSSSFLIICFIEKEVLVFVNTDEIISSSSSNLAVFLYSMLQIIKKNEEIISEATVQLVTVNKEGKPIKIPEILNNLLN